MLVLIKEFQKEDLTIYKLILIQGLKSVNINKPQEIITKLNLINSKFGVCVQVCDATRIATWEHIFFSALYAMLAFHQKQNLTNQLAMEILLYMSGQRQIKIALEEFGIKSGNDIILILGNSEETLKQALIECEKLLGGVKSDEVMALDDNSKVSAIKGYFQINNTELNAVAESNTKESQETALLNLILNRIALVILEK